jgi:hypothetical protein
MEVLLTFLAERYERVASRILCKLLFSGFVPFLDIKVALPNLLMEAGAP